MDNKSLNKDDSIEYIVKQYSTMIYRLAFAQTRNKCSADDIYQEVFLKYIKNRKEFESEEHRKAWLIRVTINCCKKMWASSWWRKVVLLDKDTVDENVIFETKEETTLYYSLKKLPLKYRAVIHLFYYEDMSIKEISKSLNRKKSTVRTQYFNKYVSDSKTTALVLSQPMDFPVEGIDFTGIGYINDMLHIQTSVENNLTKDNHGYFFLKDKDGNRVNLSYDFGYAEKTYTGKRISYYECVLDIPQSEIDEYSLFGDFWISTSFTTGDWEVTFPLEDVKKD